MASVRTLNVLRSSYNGNKEEFLSLLDACAAATDSQEIRAAGEKLKNFLASANPSLVYRSDLGDVFQSPKNRLLHRARRLSNSMFSDAVQSVQQQIAQGKLDQLKEKIGAPSTTVSSPSEIPNKVARRNWNEEASIVLGRPVSVVVDMSGVNPLIVIELKDLKRPHNDCDADVKDVETSLTDVLKDWVPSPLSDALRRNCVEVKHRRANAFG